MESTATSNGARTDDDANTTVKQGFGLFLILKRRILNGYRPTTGGKYRLTTDGRC